MTDQIIYDARDALDDGEVLISFIVPVFNTEAFLRETLDSIACLDSQNIEIIVVDDGSTDRSSDVINNWMRSHKFPSVHIWQPNAGPSAARMAGLKKARGEFVGFCDSDDRLDVAVYLKLAEIAKRGACEVAICRSVVFDNASGESHDFYDAPLWHWILAGQSSVTVNAARDCRIFQLEPNVNTRLWQRSFALENNLSFPIGLTIGEDFPTHIDALGAAHRVLLLDSTGYFYRVNRAGKITDEKSARRFDILQSVTLALRAAQKRQVNIEGMAHILAMASRLIYWCGKNTLNKDRVRFFTMACQLIRERVPRPVVNYCINSVVDEREGILLSAFSTNSVPFLVSHASRQSFSPFVTLRMLLDWQFGDKPRAVAKRMMLAKFRTFFATVFPIAYKKS
ncbi:glycosyltransferase family A protein [Phyllobacterium sp. OV277]|uniref:glycosyltransferase family 2 protein n=1 Tax=Phyllobacterium sp. OV277 TaxID=1882772 RepID=UPI000886B15D|nr:glycosyltransferase family A protein [Phyllobacterium sp. OV277]SDN97920.1 Glycosyl transferase family 2 [Phyllobacterium sp. OV277]